jgi:hypothetical protein
VKSPLPTGRRHQPAGVHARPAIDCSPQADDDAIKAATIALMSSTYGFALLRMGDRIRPFMHGRLTQSDLVDAVLSMKVATLPRGAGRKRRKESAR